LDIFFVDGIMCLFVSRLSLVIMKLYAANKVYTFVSVTSWPPWEPRHWDPPLPDR